MATQFQQFVNRELPKRIWVETPASGNLEAGKFLVTTGRGLEVQLINNVGGGGGSLTETVEQLNHGFISLNAIYHDGTNWNKAKADNQATLGTHIVVSVVDTNKFVKAMIGSYVINNHGLTPGEYYFVSASVDGGLTEIEPPIFSNPILKVIDSNVIEVLPYRPSITNDVTDDDYTKILFQDSITDVTQTLINSRILTLSDIPISKSDVVLLNGIELSRGSTRDYTISNNKITFTSNAYLNVNDVVKVRYAIGV